eukprot:CAMPEP_0170540684 /NCGR_PEP_ID=MMETSP0211-20121228/644_1 /TAXON_ID=311385 /ORGANISM="Pseudokeronopsis sp., Strain OXSARD2" /LENGTH=45 /DNA_ID= /DNA_START= /DNA_END= /DNA_ORIENTATION=
MTSTGTKKKVTYASKKHSRRNSGEMADHEKAELSYMMIEMLKQSN